MKIFHTSDLHLGRRRLDGRLPDEDLADAFGFIADQAIDEKADVFVLAGDLFDRPQVEPPNLRQAQEILQRLKDAKIPVVAIEGNHDKAFIHSGDPTWVRFLADDNLMMLLQPEFDGEGAILNPWDSESRKGAFVDIDGVRFVGAGYLGAATPNKVRQILEKLEPEKTHLMLLHAGPDYFVGEGGGFSRDDLKAIESAVCYLALGHIHKPMLHGEWACNPGSPENCDLREVGYDFDRQGEKTGRGYAVLEVDLKNADKPKSLEIRSNPRRPCHRLELDCTPFGNKLKNGSQAFVDASVKSIKAAKVTEDSVVELQLTGKLNLNRIALDIPVAAEEICEAGKVFAVSIEMSGLNVDSDISTIGDETEGVSRESLERNAIRGLVDGENLWGLDSEQKAFANLFFELKEAVQEKANADQLAEKLINSPLVGKIAYSIANPPMASVDEDAEPELAAETSAVSEGNAEPETELFHLE